MARRFVLLVAALALMFGMGASTVGVATVAAQTVPTAPPTVDLTCHGYDEGATRAYNCIPEPSQQHYMRTFVPPVGSACDAGSIAEFPAGRIVFQIRCRDGSRGQTAAWSHWGRGSASFDMPEDASARFWVHTAFSGSSVHFVVRCRAPQERVVVNELLGTSWGNTGTNGIYGMAGCREVEVDTGGQDLQWWFTQELAATASMPPQSWEQVTGAGGALPALALQDLAAAVDLERLSGPPSHWGIQPPMDANDRADLRTSDAEGISLSGPIIASRPPDDRTHALDGPSVRGATTPTVPLTLDLTCHGYVEAAGTRAYNCIPVPSQQHHMQTFVPRVGSACDAGSIAEFPPGRIVFQIRCRDSGALYYQVTINDFRFVRIDGPDSNGQMRYWLRVTATNTGVQPFTQRLATIGPGGQGSDRLIPALFPWLSDVTQRRSPPSHTDFFFRDAAVPWNPGETRTDTAAVYVWPDLVSLVHYYEVANNSNVVGCVGCGVYRTVPNR